jgi:hypothetical protein
MIDPLGVSDVDELMLKPASGSNTRPCALIVELAVTSML